MHSKGWPVQGINIQTCNISHNCIMSLTSHHTQSLILRHPQSFPTHGYATLSDALARVQLSHFHLHTVMGGGGNLRKSASVFWRVAAWKPWTHSRDWIHWWIQGTRYLEALAMMGWWLNEWSWCMLLSKSSRVVCGCVFPVNHEWYCHVKTSIQISQDVVLENFSMYMKW